MKFEEGAAGGPTPEDFSFARELGEIDPLTSGTNLNPRRMTGTSLVPFKATRGGGEKSSRKRKNDKREAGDVLLAQAVQSSRDLPPGKRGTRKSGRKTSTFSRLARIMEVAAKA